MASSPMSMDPAYAHNQILEQAQRELWDSLSEQQQQEFWLRAASNLPHNAFNAAAQPALVQETPRSMAYGLPHVPTPDPSSMGRTHSAPASVPMGRTGSPRTESYGISSSALDRKSISAMSWQSSNNEPLGGEYILSSGAAAVSTRHVLDTIDESSAFATGDIHVYEPEQYINTHIQPPHPTSLSPSHHASSHRLSVAPLTQIPQWIPSFDGSISPSTPSTAALMTPTLSSSNMSRQGSFNPFLDNFSMSRHDSEFSDMYPILNEDGPISFSSDSSKSISACADTAHFTFTGVPSEDCLSASNVSASASALTQFPQTQLDLVEDMRRSASISSDSDSSNASAPSTSSRQLRREREIKAQASRKIAPRAIQCNDGTKSKPSNDQMVRTQSQDGSSKIVGVISKAPYIRPQHPKIMCPHCDHHATGFRGTHELDRHIARAHAKVRKAYICVDYSADKTFLAKCKHCRNKKEYGAYYNAAAHLRRAHFHPRKRGRKGKNDEKRGGSGGGDDPPMEYLRQHWIKEIEVPNTPISPESPSVDMNDAADNDDDSFELNDVALPSSSQVTNDAPNMLDVHQYLDPSMFMNPSDGAAFDSILQYQHYNDPNNFQFDADMYMNH